MPAMTARGLLGNCRAARIVAMTVGLALFGATLPIPSVDAQSAPHPSTTCRADGPVATAMLPTVEPIVRRWLGQHPESNTPGFAIGIVGPGPDGPATAETALIACGVLETGSDTPVVSSTQFELGSETKLFTAVALAQRVLNGTASLDSPVQTHAPDGVTVPDKTCAGAESAAMTIRDLATHNAGLQDDPRNITWNSTSAPEGHSDYDRTLLWDSFTSGYTSPCEALLTTPGTAYSYSNWGFALLGTILADSYRPGQAVPPYAAMMSDLVTGPLGMTSTVLQLIPAPATQAVPTCAPGASAPCYWDNVNAFAGAGGAISDVIDMATFVRANLGFERGNPAWPALRLTQQPAGIGPLCQTCQGLAWGITPAGSSALSPLRVLNKDGGTWGSHSQTYLLPDACWGITVLSNSNEQDAVSEGGVGGDLVKALAPTQTHASCGEAGTSPTTITPTASPAVVSPRFTG